MSSIELPSFLRERNIYVIYGIITFALLTLLIIILKILISRHIKNKYTEQVLSTSMRLKAINHLNSTYDFYENLQSEYLFYWDVNTKQKFDRFDFKRNFKEEIALDMNFFLNIINQADINRERYTNYVYALNSSPEYASKNDSCVKHFNYKRYLKYEQLLCAKEILHPVTEILFKCVVRYTSPAGRNCYRDYMYFEPNQIYDLINEIHDDEKRKESAAYQRSMMTPSLRYDVLKRDGFRCVLCGRSAESGVELHVDHILPVSKGGKTIMSNLRTLCADCNSGKSDKYDEYGLN